MTARYCPHCSAPVRGGGRPSCLCAAIGADDFDPLRVRPYVSLPDGEEGADEAGAGGERAGEDDVRSAGRGDRLDDLPGVDAAVHRADASAPSTLSAPSTPSASSAPYAPAAPPAASPGPLLPRARRRSGPTSRTFHAAEGQASGTARSAPRRAGVRARRPAVLVATGAAAAVAAALIGTDALSGGTRDRAAPPDRSTASPSAALPSAALPTGGAPTPGGTASSPAARRSPSPEATATGPSTATVRLPGTGRPRTPAPTRASGSVSVPPGSPVPGVPPVLREGAAGPEVRELQARLWQLGLYQGAGGGRYDAEVRAAVSRYQRRHGVTGDPDGVYGPRTRASLESRTDEP